MWSVKRSVCVCARARARRDVGWGRGGGAKAHTVQEYSETIRTTRNILAAITDIRVNLKIHL